MSTGSVAPKERINIRYKSAVGDQQQDIELPFKQVVIGKFGTTNDDTPLEDRNRINVDKDNFEKVLKAFKLSLDLNVSDKLTESGDEFPVSLSFETMRDFEPERIIAQVPQLQKIYELRQALLALKAPLGNVPEFRKTLERILNDDTQRQALLQEL